MSNHIGKNRIYRIGFAEAVMILGSKETARRIGKSHKWLKRWLSQNAPRARRYGTAP